MKLTSAGSTMRKMLLVCAALVVALPASAAVRYRGGFGFGPGWGYGYGPYYYDYGYWPPAHPNAGQVKIDTKVKDAQVYVNGAYAGMVGELKSSMWLRQGTYNIEVRSPGGPSYASQVYVITGKTLHVHPGLNVEPKS